MSQKPKLLIGVQLHDAATDLILHIRAVDVAKAEAKDPLNCAAARALKRQLKASEACVMRARTYVNVGTKRDPTWLRFLTPESLSREIVAIDRGGKFMPDSYKLKAPTRSQKLGQHRSGSGSGSSRKRRKHLDEPLHRHVTANIREV